MNHPKQAALPWSRAVVEANTDVLAPLFRQHGVLAAYIFGSLARGRDPSRVTLDSDLDLAVLLPWEWTPDERRQAALSLEHDLWGLFGRGDMDLVVANDAPLILQHRIIRERDILFGRDAPERVGFEWRTFREYLDTQPMRNTRYTALLRRAREGRFGDRSGTGTPPTRRA